MDRNAYVKIVFFPKMKTPSNESNSLPAWLGEALGAHFAESNVDPAIEQPSPDFGERCQTAALRAVDVLKMQRYRTQIADAPGSLSDHFRALARLAGVDFEGILRSLGIVGADARDVGVLRRLAQLAISLGLARDEAVLRLRWEFAWAASAVAPGDWPLAVVPVRRFRTGGANKFSEKQKGGDAQTALRRAESKYDSARRAELRKATNALAEVYERDTP